MKGTTMHSKNKQRAQVIVPIVLLALIMGLAAIMVSAGTARGDDQTCPVVIHHEAETHVVHHDAVTHDEVVPDYKTQYHFRKFTRTRTEVKPDHGPKYWGEWSEWTPWSPETHTSWEDSDAPLGEPAPHASGVDHGLKWERQWQARFDGQTRSVKVGEHTITVTDEEAYDETVVDKEAWDETVPCTEPTPTPTPSTPTATSTPTKTPVPPVEVETRTKYHESCTQTVILSQHRALGGAWITDNREVRKHKDSCHSPAAPHGVPVVVEEGF